MISSRPDPVVLERSVLFDDVWSRPCTQIAAGLGISSSALKRICMAMNIPTPPVGHWAQVQFGKAMKKPALPKAGPETKLKWQVDMGNSLSQKSRKLLRPDPAEDRVDAEEAAEEWPKVQLAANLENLHVLVKATRAQWRESRSKIPWDQRKERKRFNASVAAASEERALILLDAFARGAEAVGITFVCSMDPGMNRPEHSYQYSYQQRPSGLCWAQVGDERVSFSMREKSRRTKLEPEEAKRHWREWREDPCGVLEFSLESPWGFKLTTTWKDGKRQKVEDRLPEIIRTVQLLADYKRDERIRRQEEADRLKLEQERRERIAQFRAKMDSQRKNESTALDKAVQAAQAWQTAALLRRYVDAMKTKFLTQPEAMEANSPAKMYMDWLCLRADLMDPMVKAYEYHPASLASNVPGLLAIQAK
ncbi:MAG: hypothetical protein CJBNEKGG_03984 [Prosthecobacter sp.]|nr:hypothetical protein [Prosthecobacter sp.]